MEYWRTLLVSALVFCLTHASMAAATLPAATSIRDQAGRFGVGARVKLKLAIGERLQGSIDTLGEDSLVLTAHDGTRTISYEQIAELKLAKLRYKAGRSDPAEVRRVVTGLGVGKHVVVRVASGMTVRGHIQQIGDERFKVLPDRGQTPVAISYADVRHAEKNLSFGATLAIIVGVVAGAIVLVAVIKSQEGNK